MAGVPSFADEPLEAGLFDPLRGSVPAGVPAVAFELAVAFEPAVAVGPAAAFGRPATGGFIGVPRGTMFPIFVPSRKSTLLPFITKVSSL
jgi:hypothetical protein